MKRHVFASLILLFLFAARGWSSDADRPLWISVTAPEFRAALEPLCEHRRAEGMDVRIISTADFSEATQIRAKIDSERRGRTAPTFVLLVGATRAASGGIAQSRVPSFDGTEGRMKGVPTDHGYGCP